MSDECVNVTSELQPCVSVATGSGESVSAASEAPSCVGVTTLGPQGIPGVTGPTGAVGNDGTDGADGTDGVVGATGATGPAHGSTGPTGPEGATGIPGHRWFSGAFQPTLSDDYRFQYDPNTDKISEMGTGGIPGWTEIADLSGNVGPTGPQGPIGALAQGAKSMSDDGSVGDRSLGQINNIWYLFVCYAPGQWARVKLDTYW